MDIGALWATTVYSITKGHDWSSLARTHASISGLLDISSRVCGRAPEVTLVKGTGVGGDKQPSAELADGPCAWLYKHL